MKRGIIAGALLLLSLIISIFCHTELIKELKNVENRIEEIKISCQNENIQAAEKESIDLIDYWESKRPFISIVVERDSVKDIENGINLFNELIKEESFDEASTLCIETEAQIEFLLQEEKITFYNIF